MKKTIATACCTALTFTLISAQAAQAGAKIQGSEIKKILTGKTVSGIAGKSIKFTKTYHADGTYELEVDGDTSTGKWWIKDDQYCQSRGEQEEECYSMEKKGAGYTMKNKAGEMHTTFSIKQ